MDEFVSKLKTLFVYGTLKRGCSNHHVLQAARFLKTAWTLPGYRLYTCGAYPALVKVEPGEAVCGELFAVDAHLLAVVDRFEDAPNEYARLPIELSCGTPAEAYFYNWSTRQLCPCGAEWREP